MHQPMQVAKWPTDCQCVPWKVLTVDNSSLRVLWIRLAGAGSAIDSIVCSFCLNVNTLITAGDATAGVSLFAPPRLSSRVSSSLSCFFFFLPPQFCLIAIITCPQNGIHLKPTSSGLYKHLFSSSLDIRPLFQSLTVMGETEKVPCFCLASLLFSFYFPSADFSRRPDSGASDSLGENRHFDISHPKMPERMALLLNTVHYCFDSWWPGFNLSAPASAKTAHKWDFLTSRCWARWKLRGCTFFFFLSYAPLSPCPYSLPYNQVFLLLSFLQESDYFQERLHCC